MAALLALHADPFVRVLVATCRVEHLPVLSSDPRLASYGIEVVDATR